MTMSKSEAGKLGYLSSKQKQQYNKEKRIEEYNTNPKYCKFCGKFMPYEKRNKKFCNRSCSISYNNHITKRKAHQLCIVCGKEVKKVNGKFCSKACFNTHKIEINMLSKIQENGDIISSTEQTARRIAKKFLIKKNGYKCEICGNSEWLGKPILLIADHIDGDPTHNNINNFRLICSNCDATLETYKNRNQNKNKRKNRKKYYSGLV